MKIEKSFWIQQMTGETFATFGTARLVRHLDGHFELSGGTPADHAAAREWCSLFAPEIVFKSGSRLNKSAHPARTAYAV